MLRGPMLTPEDRERIEDEERKKLVEENPRGSPGQARGRNRHAR